MKKLILKTGLLAVFSVIQVNFSYADDFKSSFDAKYGSELLKEAQEKASKMTYADCDHLNGERYSSSVSCENIDECITNIWHYQKGDYGTCTFHWPQNKDLTYKILPKLYVYRDLRDKIISDYKSDNFKL